ncbi:MAG: alpha/beta hydrolase [Bacteroidota bacterium]
MKLPFSILIFLVFLSAECFAQTRFVTVDGYKTRVNTISIENRKEGQPVVVFESGHGVPMDNWDKVLEPISELAPVVAYERAGIGKSEADGKTPSIRNVADRLIKILNQLELEPPYVLVGHSLGGVYVRGFATYYPELLAGLVIIDPADFTENKQNIRDYYEVLNWEPLRVDSLINGFVERRKMRNANAAESIRKESEVLENLRENEFREITQNPLPNIPVHIITGGKFDMPEKFRSEKYDDEALFRSKLKHRVARWTDVVQSVDRGMLFYSGHAGHYVHWDDPELVISSIKIVLQDYVEMMKEN